MVQLLREGQTVQLTKTLHGIGFSTGLVLKKGERAIVRWMFEAFVFQFDGLDDPIIYAEDPDTGNRVMIRNFVEAVEYDQTDAEQAIMKAAQELVSFLNSQVLIEDALKTNVDECIAGVERWVRAFNADSARLREYHVRWTKLAQLMADNFELPEQAKHKHIRMKPAATIKLNKSDKKD